MIAALLFALISPEPALPIPVGAPQESGPILRFSLSSSCGVKFGCSMREADGTEHHWTSTGVAGTWRASVQDDEFLRVTRLNRVAGTVPEKATRRTWYLLNSWSFDIETADDPRTLPHFRIELHYYPLEGLGFSAGFDSRTYDLFAGIQLVF